MERSFITWGTEMRASTRIAGAAGIVLLLCPSAHARILGQERVAGELTYPVFATHGPNDPNRLFIAEVGSPDENSNATANIRILNLDTGVLEPTPFLTITGLNTTGEGGLLGMAFHPDYETNGKFYVYLTADDNVAGTPFSSYVRQYEVSANPNVANTGFTPILNFTQPQTNHDGGWIGFGPNDGYLYVMTGDGGGTGDDDAGHTAGTGNAQDIEDNLLGKVLRIDVDGDDFAGDANLNYAIPASNPFVAATGDDEIWAYGLRNPYRAVSTATPAICGSVMWARAIAKRSTTNRPRAPAARTTAGDCGKVTSHTAPRKRSETRGLCRARVRLPTLRHVRWQHGYRRLRLPRSRCRPARPIHICRRRRQQVLDVRSGRHADRPDRSGGLCDEYFVAYELRLAELPRVVWGG